VSAVAEGQLDPQVIRDFYQQVSQRERGRWTSNEMLDFDLRLLRGLAPNPVSILDLGSGHGELSRPLAGDHADLVAVDFAPAYGSSFGGARHTFVPANLEDFESARNFDLILLFGVVTYTDIEQEARLYRRIVRWLDGDGLLVVKNQCALGTELVKTGYSEALDAEYSARYPTAEEQHQMLASVFGSVEEQKYPDPLNTWADTVHIAFICRDPLT